MARRGKAADVDAILMLMLVAAAAEEEREKSEADRREWEEDAGVAPQRRHGSREEGPCERSREAKARRRRAGEAEKTIIDVIGMRGEGRGGDGGRGEDSRTRQGRWISRDLVMNALVYLPVTVVWNQWIQHWL